LAGRAPARQPATRTTSDRSNRATASATSQAISTTVRLVAEAASGQALRSCVQRRHEMRFHTTILQGDKTATGIQVPPEIVEALGAGKRPAVTVTINGFTYRSSIAVLGGTYMVGVSAENRAGAGVSGGDQVDVDIELDTAPREVAVPADLAAALDAYPAARSTFERLSYSNKSWHVLQITGSKTDETRTRRISKSIEALREGRIR
jgi:hypothetical protein